MVLGELFEPAVPLEIRARVTDVSDRDAAPVDDGDRHRRAHPGDVRVLGGALVDALVRRLDQRDDAFLAASAGLARLHRCRGQSGCDLTGARPAHAVRHREQRRLDNVGVLVMAPLAPRMRRTGVARDSHCSNLRSVSPIRTTSPGVSLRGRSIRVPLTNVPFVEPMSSTQTPSRRGSMRACLADTNSSSCSSMSFGEPRPTVSGAESSWNSSPSSSAGLLSTTRVARVGAGCWTRPAAAAWPGARMKLSCGRRTSLAALRTMRQMNK